MKKILFSVFAMCYFNAVAQEPVSIIDTTKTEKLDEVLVRSVRVQADSPITHSNLSKEQLAQRNLGQDIATQLNFLPGVVTTSDAGAFDARRPRLLTFLKKKKARVTGNQKHLKREAVTFYFKLFQSIT
jgi:hypothetical protein